MKVHKKIKIFLFLLCCIIVLTIAMIGFQESTVNSLEGKLKDIEISSLIMGGEHLQIIDNKGNLYSYGYNMYRQTGQRKNTINDISITKKPYVMSPQKVNKNILLAVNGEWHSLILDKENNLYSIGNNRYGQLGNKELSSLSPVMPDAASDEYTMIDKDKEITKIDANWMQSAFITTDGELFLWGNNEFGNLGNGKIGDLDEETRDCYIQTPQKIYTQVDDVSLGKEHTLLLTDRGEVYAAGSNTFGQLGIEDKDSQKNFAYVMGNIKYIESGFRTSYAIDTKNNLWAWGDNRDNQVSSKQDDIIDNPIVIEKNVESVTSGVNHAVILLKNGYCYVIGSDEYGQKGGTSLSRPIKNVVDIFSSDNTIIIKKEDNTYWGWGDNQYRLLSDISDSISDPILLN